MVDIGGLIDRLTPLVKKTVKEECNLWINSKTEAKILLSNLQEVQNVIEEAQKRRLADPRVKTWLEKLRGVTYEIDDALDEWEVTDRRLQIHDNNWWKKMMNIFICPFRSCINYISGSRDVAFRIKKLNEKVDFLGKETAKYSMLPISSDSQDVSYEITTSFSDLIEIPGQRFYKDWLVDKLLTIEGEKPHDIKVISLVGMAGIGKTTVAQLAFNDLRVQSKFEVKLWICTSHNSDMIGLTKAILKSLRVSYCENAELEMLLEIIRSSIFGKTFLIVLDHAWKEDDSMWNQLKASLLCGNAGSRILVTTRNEKLAALMGSTVTIEFDQLSDEDCWSLFSEKAFRGRSKEERDNLGGIGQEIAKKCKGWPHAAKTLGEHLQLIVNKELWDDVLEKELWELNEVADVLFTPFTFNCNELPMALQHSFSFCAIYPDDVCIEVDELIRLWTVQGYLSSIVANTEAELKGRDCFEKLARCYFFQDPEMDDLGEKIRRCQMHPILLNFAQYLAKNERKAQGLRIFYGKLEDCLHQIKEDNLKFVRVLFVSEGKMEDPHVMESKTQDLLKDIGKLIHLRYINLALNRIKQLPGTICDLHHLYCLDLRKCTQLSELPEQIHRLKNLRQLLVNGSGVKQLPSGLGKLTYLQTLDAFYVGKEASKFRYLDNLDRLRGSMYICVSDMNEEEDVEDAKKANLSRKKYISGLQLVFRGEVSMDVLDHLQVPPNLRHFRVSGYKGTQFPSWIGNSFEKLTILEFEAWQECIELPPVGKLPFLEILRVTRMVSLRRIGNEIWEYPSGEVIFPKLRKLELRDCALLEEWEDITKDAANTFSVMPLLETLTLMGCRRLKALPNLILHKATSFRCLEIVQGCPHLSERYQPKSPEWNFIFRIPESDSRGD